jgi:hypothetical protein
MQCQCMQRVFLDCRGIVYIGLVVVVGIRAWYMTCKLGGLHHAVLLRLGFNWVSDIAQSAGTS